MTEPMLFDVEPVERVEDVPVSLALLVEQFIHRWGYNTTAQDRMRPELDALIAFARGEQ